MAPKQSKKGSKNLTLADQDGHMIQAYPNKDSNSKGWKVLCFNDEVEADDSEHEDYIIDEDRCIHKWIRASRQLVAEIKTHDDVLDYCVKFWDVPPAFTRFTLLSEAAYNGSDAGMTQEIMLDDYEEEDGATGEDEDTEMDYDYDPLDFIEDADLTEDNSANQKVFNDKRRVQADQMQQQMERQFKQMKLAMEAEYKAKEAAMLEKNAVQQKEIVELRKDREGESWTSVADMVGLNSEPNMQSMNSLWLYLYDKGVIQVEARKKRFKGPSDITESRVAQQNLAESILKQNEEIHMINNMFADKKYNSLTKHKDKDCNFVNDLMLLISKMPDGDCNLENIRELSKMLESIGKLIEKRREMAGHELYEKKYTDQIKDEDAIRRRKLNQGAWGTKARQAKKINKRKPLKYNRTPFI
jgi:hypothetical protein